MVKLKANRFLPQDCVPVRFMPLSIILSLTITLFRPITFLLCLGITVDW
jgi:hypothetical protein